MKKARFGVRSVGAATAVLLVVFVSGCGTVGDDPDASASAPQGAVGGRYLASEAVKAMAQLETLPVKGLGPRTGYSRDEFGSAWADTDHNGCDTRNDILARDLTNETFKSGTNNCVVTTGTLVDKYTGTTINFVAARAPAPPYRSITSLRSVTPGKRADSNSALISARNWPTTRRT